MKILSILLGTAITATLLYSLYVNQPSSNGLSELSQFHSFKDNFNKEYHSIQEREYRFQIFQQNLKKIQKWSQTKTFSVGINQFSDLTWEEFTSSYLMTPIKNTLNKSATKTSNDEIDWREKGIVSEVKDQGMCGSCWAFSTTGSMEAFLAQKDGNLTEFSEQQLVDCSRDYGNYGCNGGLMSQAYDYIAKSGLETEADYPYRARDQKCKADAGKSTHKVT